MMNRMRRILFAALALAMLLPACSRPDTEALLASARKSMAARDDKAALIELKSALQQSPDSREARFLFGKTLLSGGNASAAEVELRKAMDRNYPADEVVPVLAQAMLANVKLKALVDEFKDVKLSTSNAQASLKASLSAAYAALGMAEQSEAALKEALAARPDDVKALVLQARLYMGRREVPAAQQLLSQLLAAHPQDADVWKLNGDVLRAVNGDESGALAAYRKAIEFDRLNLPAHVEAINILFERNNLDDIAAQVAHLSSVAAMHPQTSYFRARLAYRKRDYTDARDALQQTLKVAPEYTDALELAGATELALGALPAARAQLLKVTQAAPQRAAAWRLLAQVHLRSDAPSQALAVLQPLLATGKDAAAMNLAGEAYLTLGDPGKAQRAFADAVKLDPKNTRGRTALAVMKVQQGSVAPGLEVRRCRDLGNDHDPLLVAALEVVVDEPRQALLGVLDHRLRRPRRQHPPHREGAVGLLLQREADVGRRRLGGGGRVVAHGLSPCGWLPTNQVKG